MMIPTADGFKGELQKTLPSIFNWVKDMPLNEAKEIVSKQNLGKHLL